MESNGGTSGGTEDNLVGFANDFEGCSTPVGVILLGSTNPLTPLEPSNSLGFIVSRISLDGCE